MTDILFYVQFPSEETARHVLVAIDRILKIISKDEHTYSCLEEEEPLLIKEDEISKVVFLEDDKNVSGFQILLSKVLDSTGMNRKCSGYNYLIETCMFMYMNNRFDYMITKDIYPMLALKNNVSCGSVEQAMRNVIKRVWDMRNETDAYNNDFWRGFTHRPSNKEFINRILEVTGVVHKGEVF